MGISTSWALWILRILPGDITSIGAPSLGPVELEGVPVAIFRRSSVVAALDTRGTSAGKQPTTKQYPQPSNRYFSEWWHGVTASIMTMLYPANNLGNATGGGMYGSS